MLYQIEDPIVSLTNGYFGELNIVTILIRIFFSLLFSALIGVERSNKRHTAGLRTFMLVSLASSLASLMDLYVMANFDSTIPFISVGAIISIAIISSNTLLYSSKSQIKGLTTAVALWSNAFIGLSLGAGLYTISLIAFLALIFTLNILPTLETYLKNKSNHFEIHLELKNKTDLQLFTSTIRKLGIIIDDIESNPAYINSGLSVYKVSLTVNSKELHEYKTHKEIIDALKTLDFINCIEEMN